MYLNVLSDVGFMSRLVHLLAFLLHSYYNWAVAAPMVLSMTAFQKNLPKVYQKCQDIHNVDSLGVLNA